MWVVPPASTATSGKLPEPIWNGVAAWAAGEGESGGSRRQNGENSIHGAEYQTDLGALYRLLRLMSLAVVGSIAFDAVKTPFGERERMLGGSAVHFSLAASFFSDVRVVRPVGDDFGDTEYGVLHARGVNTDDIEHVEGGKTFFWAGEYEYDLNT